MPRKARVESKTKIYHVMSRALNKQILFDDEKDFLKFLNIVKSTKSEIDFDLYGYCIMSNHYHLLIKDKSNKLSAIMNKINSRYANYYNLKFVENLTCDCRFTSHHTVSADLNTNDFLANKDNIIKTLKEEIEHGDFETMEKIRNNKRSL